jgi:hypothetical protein
MMPEPYFLYTICFQKIKLYNTIVQLKVYFCGLKNKTNQKAQVIRNHRLAFILVLEFGPWF